MDTHSNEYTEKLETTIKHGYQSLLLVAGFKLKIFDHLGDEQAPKTSVEIAQLANLKERYTREWLNGMVVSRFIECDSSGQKYWMISQAKQALQSQKGKVLGYQAVGLAPPMKVLDAICECATVDGPMGLPYSAYGEGIHRVIADFYVVWRDQALLQHIIPSIPGLQENLEAGITCVDVGCGTGAVSMILAARFPQSQFYGVDVCLNVIEDNMKRAKEKNLSNTHFVVADAKQMPSEWTSKFDYATAFDTVHDLARADLALKEIVRILKPGGQFSVSDVDASSNVHENIGDHKASIFYAVSLFHCVPVSLSFPESLGLGLMMGRQKAISLLEDAGFGTVVLVDQPWDKYKLNAHYLCTKT